MSEGEFWHELSRNMKVVHTLVSRFQNKSQQVTVPIMSNTKVSGMCNDTVNEIVIEFLPKSTLTIWMSKSDSDVYWNKVDTVVDFSDKIFNGTASKYSLKMM